LLLSDDSCFLVQMEAVKAESLLEVTMAQAENKAPVELPGSEAAIASWTSVTRACVCS